jgi:hypothetical protein
MPAALLGVGAWDLPLKRGLGGGIWAVSWGGCNCDEGRGMASAMGVSMGAGGMGREEAGLYGGCGVRDDGVDVDVD